MDIKKPSPEQRALAAQQRKTEGEKALADHRARQIAIDKNTERLRALRLARDAQAPPPTDEPKKKRATRAKSSKASLTDYLKQQQDSGRGT